MRCPASEPAAFVSRETGSAMALAIAYAALAGSGLATWKAPQLTSVILWALVATIFLGAALLIAFPGPFAEKAIWLSLLV